MNHFRVDNYSRAADKYLFLSRLRARFICHEAPRFMFLSLMEMPTKWRDPPLASGAQGQYLISSATFLFV
jgi:hypothetical protein